jgi:putative transposase
MNYRRAKIAGGTYFFTVVTHVRLEIFDCSENVQLLREIIRHVKSRYPFTIDAIVVLPDHLHCIWTLPKGDADFSTRWRLIKSNFSRQVRIAGRPDSVRRWEKNDSHKVWQNRFWEHCIRNEDDFERHFDYVHYNPVKHGLVDSPRDWKYSSFQRYVQRGVLDLNWASGISLDFPEFVGHE